MNLRNTHENSSYTFYAVTLGIVGSFLAIGALMVVALYKAGIFIS